MSQWVKTSDFSTNRPSMVKQPLQWQTVVLKLIGIITCARMWFTEVRYHQQFLCVMQHFQGSNVSFYKLNEPGNYRVVFQRNCQHKQSTCWLSADLHNVTVHKNCFIATPPENPWRSTYQRLRSSLKCCWQHRILSLCERFRFVWFKLSRTQQELNLAQRGDYTPQRERRRETTMIVSLSCTCRVFLQLRFGGLNAWIWTHCWLGDHSQVFFSSDLLQSCFLVHLQVSETDADNIKHTNDSTSK